MSDTKKQYRTVVGIIQFDPKDGEAGGKKVTNFVVSNAGFKEQAVRVYCTLWPEHKDVEIARGDAVIVEGSYRQTKKTDDEGDTKTYHNISVTRIAKIGKAVEGIKPDTVDDGGDAEDDDVPY